MLLLLAFIFFSNTACALQSPFIQNKIDAFYVYEKSLGQAIEEEDKLLSVVTIEPSAWQNRKNNLIKSTVLGIVEEQVSVLPKFICMLILEYVHFAPVKVRSHNPFDGDYLIDMHQINESNIMATIGPNALTILWNPMRNTAEMQSEDEIISWENNIMSIPKELQYNQQEIYDFDQSDNRIVIAGSTGIFMWEKGLSLDQAMLGNKIIKISNRKAINNPHLILDNSVKFSTCEHALIIGGLDGVLRVVDIATGDQAYSITYNKSIMALSKGSNGSLLVALKDGEVDVWENICTYPSLMERVQSLHDDLGPVSLSMSEEEASFLTLPEEYDSRFQYYGFNTSCLYDCFNCVDYCAVCVRTAKACCYTAGSCLKTCPQCCCGAIIFGCGSAISQLRQYLRCGW